MTSVVVEKVAVTLGDEPALRDVSFTAPTGGWMAVVGPNGAGKTTLLRTIAGLIRGSGDIALGEERVAELSRRRLSRLVALVPQRPFIPSAMTLVDYVLLGRTPYIPYLRSESRHDLEVVARTLEQLELASFASRTLGSLSGGELQRALLARALAQQAPVLLLDEPTAALDVGRQQQVLELVDALRATHALTIVAAMHDLTLAAQFADTLVLLDAGRVVAAGPPSSVLTEEAIREHYEASARVLDAGDAGIAVVPVRDDGRSARRAAF